MNPRKVPAHRRPPALILLCFALAPCSAPAEPALPLLDADGLEAVLEAHRGEVLLVNFWATWCRPCLDEIPALMALDERLGDAGFELVAVSLDDAALADDTVRPFMARFFPGFASYQSAMPTMDALVSVLDPGWNEILPTSYVVDREGRVVERIQGGQAEADFAAAIEPLLAP